MRRSTPDNPTPKCRLDLQAVSGTRDVDAIALYLPQEEGHSLLPNFFQTYPKDSACKLPRNPGVAVDVENQFPALFLALPPRTRQRTSTELRSSTV